MNSRKSLITLFIAFGVVCTFSPSTFAGDKEEEFAICHEKATSTADMHACLYLEMEYYDANLNTLYREIRKESAGRDEDSKEITKRLVLAQRAWIKFRDANCSFESTSMLNGSGEGLIFHSCKVRMTKERIKELSSQR